MWVVDIVEVARGEGEKVTEQKTFPSEKSAWEFVKEYNRDLAVLYEKQAQLPDFYVIARKPYNVD